MECKQSPGMINLVGINPTVILSIRVSDLIGYEYRLITLRSDGMLYSQHWRSEWMEKYTIACGLGC
jgi:hypothetical protein